MQTAGFPFARVVAMSGSGQQHGSVYWRRGSKEVLGGLQPDKTLANQLKVTKMMFIISSVLYLRMPKEIYHSYVLQGK